ncbi:MAG: hypothetical protein GDA52_05535 [Rhodobacteraceae bacterium]|nr:hypothetical protein [Paracoccaceae bacterium]
MQLVVFNAAEEVALDGFLAGRIGFTDVSGVAEDTLDAIARDICLHDVVKTLETALQTDHLSRIRAREQIAARPRHR